MLFRKWRETKRVKIQKICIHNVRISMSQENSILPFLKTVPTSPILKVNHVQLNDFQTKLSAVAKLTTLLISSTFSLVFLSNHSTWKQQEPLLHHHHAILSLHSCCPTPKARFLIFKPASNPNAIFAYNSSLFVCSFSSVLSLLVCCYIRVDKRLCSLVVSYIVMVFDSVCGYVANGVSETPWFPTQISYIFMD